MSKRKLTPLKVNLPTIGMSKSHQKTTEKKINLDNRDMTANDASNSFQNLLSLMRDEKTKSKRPYQFFTDNNTERKYRPSVVGYAGQNYLTTSTPVRYGPIRDYPESVSSISSNEMNNDPLTENEEGVIPLNKTNNCNSNNDLTNKNSRIEHKKSVTDKADKDLKTVGFITGEENYKVDKQLARNSHNVVPGSKNENPEVIALSQSTIVEQLIRSIFNNSNKSAVHTVASSSTSIQNSSKQNNRQQTSQNLSQYKNKTLNKEKSKFLENSAIKEISCNTKPKQIQIDKDYIEKVSICTQTSHNDSDLDDQPEELDIVTLNKNNTDVRRDDQIILEEQINSYTNSSSNADLDYALKIIEGASNNKVRQLLKELDNKISSPYHEKQPNTSHFRKTSTNDRKITSSCVKKSAKNELSSGQNSSSNMMFKSLYADSPNNGDSGEKSPPSLKPWRVKVSSEGLETLQIGYTPCRKRSEGKTKKSVKKDYSKKNKKQLKNSSRVTDKSCRNSDNTYLDGHDKQVLIKLTKLSDSQIENGTDKLKPSDSDDDCNVDYEVSDENSIDDYNKKSLLKVSNVQSKAEKHLDPQNVCRDESDDEYSNVNKQRSPSKIANKIIIHHNVTVAQSDNHKKSLGRGSCVKTTPKKVHQKSLNIQKSSLRKPKNIEQCSKEPRNGKKNRSDSVSSQPSTLKEPKRKGRSRNNVESTLQEDTVPLTVGKSKKSLKADLDKCVTSNTHNSTLRRGRTRNIIENQERDLNKSNTSCAGVPLAILEPSENVNETPRQINSQNNRSKRNSAFENTFKSPSISSDFNEIVASGKLRLTKNEESFRNSSTVSDTEHEHDLNVFKVPPPIKKGKSKLGKLYSDSVVTSTNDSDINKSSTSNRIEDKNKKNAKNISKLLVGTSKSGSVCSASNTTTQKVAKKPKVLGLIQPRRKRKKKENEKPDSTGSETHSTNDTVNLQTHGADNNKNNQLAVCVPFQQNNTNERESDSGVESMQQNFTDDSARKKTQRNAKKGLEEISEVVTGANESQTGLRRSNRKREIPRYLLLAPHVISMSISPPKRKKTEMSVQKSFAKTKISNKKQQSIIENVSSEENNEASPEKKPTTSRSKGKKTNVGKSTTNNKKVSKPSKRNANNNNESAKQVQNNEGSDYEEIRESPVVNPRRKGKTNKESEIINKSLKIPDRYEMVHNVINSADIINTSLEIPERCEMLHSVINSEIFNEEDSVHGKKDETQWYVHNFAEQNTNSQSVFVSKAFSNPIDDMGYITIKKGARKKTQAALNHKNHYYILKGRAEVNLSENKVNLTDGAAFVIPKGCSYSIKNLSNSRDLELLFSKFVPSNF